MNKTVGFKGLLRKNSDISEIIIEDLFQNSHFTVNGNKLFR